MNDHDLSMHGASAVDAAERAVGLHVVRPPDQSSVDAAVASALATGEGAWLDAWHRSLQIQRACRHIGPSRTGTDHYETILEL